jgi:quercetin dioxygenase-like cupin family protein
MKIIHFEEIRADPVEMEEARDVTIRWLIAKEDGAPHFAMRLFDIQPGGQTPLHIHEGEHEVFIVSGTGAVWREGEEVPVKAGTAIFVPPGEKHCFLNKGPDVLRFLCIVPVS